MEKGKGRGDRGDLKRKGERGEEDKGLKERKKGERGRKEEVPLNS